MKTQNFKPFITTMLLMAIATPALSSELTLGQRQVQTARKKMDEGLGRRTSKESMFEGLESKSQKREGLRNQKADSMPQFEKRESDVRNRQNLMEGNSNGGGGGGYKLANGKIVTLPEFGILIQDNVSPTTFSGKVYPRMPDYCDVSKEVSNKIDEIRMKIRKVVPSFYFRSSVIPEKRKLICKFDVNPEDYARVKQEYRTLLEAFGYQLDESKFVLPAISENGVTYLLPDYQSDGLDDTQRAKYMIHEAEMREPPLASLMGLSLLPSPTRMETLERALKIDTLIQQIAFPKEGETLQVFDVLKRLAKLNLINAEDIFHHIMLMLMSELRQELPLYSFIEDNVNLDKEITLNPSFIQELQIQYKLKNNYAEMLDGSVIYFRYDRLLEDEKRVSKFCGSGIQLSNNKRIVPDPRKYGFPEGAVRVIECGRMFGSIGIDVRYMLLQQAGPFIRSIANPE